MGNQRRDDPPERPPARPRPYAEVARSDPLAPPWWRWRRATRLAAGERESARWSDDRPTRAAVALVRHRTGRPARRPPAEALVDAAGLFDADGEPRWAVEAALLAGLTDEQVGRKFGLSPAVVGTYEAVFFDVRSRLGAADWIALHAFRGPAGPFSDQGSLLRWAGYTLGEVGLDVVRAVTTGVGRDRLPPSVVETIELTVAVGRLPILPERRLWQLHLRLAADRAGRPAAAYHLPRVPARTPPGGGVGAPPALPRADGLGKMHPGSHNTPARSGG